MLVAILLSIILVISKPLHKIGCLSSYGHSSATKIENHYETEFDERKPNTFASRNFETLVVRQEGFNSITHYDKNGVIRNTDHISNWELFALRYWYETRTPYSSCDMIPKGIATQADWALNVPCMYGDPHEPPRIIWVHNYMLPHFIESTLNFMNTSYRFVLLSGGTDLTIPRSAGDSRYTLLRGFSQNKDGGSYYQRLLNSPQLIHWFCENHDLKSRGKLSTLPTGMVGNGDDRSDFPTVIPPLQNRSIQILVSDRVRDGRGQWETRAKVQSMCLQRNDICLHPTANPNSGISHKEFISLLTSVTFVACPHGGGIDPSPKAWEALLAGTIPIIQNSVLDDAYQRLPVVFIKSWEELFQTNQTVLENWVKQLQPYYETGSELRRKTLERLTTAYWMEQVHHKIKEYEDSVDATESNRRMLSHNKPSERKGSSVNKLTEMPLHPAIFHSS